MSKRTSYRRNKAKLSFKVGKRKKIYCVGCNRKVSARLTNGREIYPHRKDLFHLPFWICDQCNSFVGCHHKTRYVTRPKGCLANEHMRRARVYIHELMDKILTQKGIARRALYAELSKYRGAGYHTGELRDIEEARDIYRFLLRFERSLE